MGTPGVQEGSEAETSVRQAAAGRPRPSVASARSRCVRVRSPEYIVSSVFPCRPVRPAASLTR